MAEKHRTSIVWLRRDLRLEDNVALTRAARESDRVVVAFVLSPELLRSDRMGAPLVQFFFDALGDLRTQLHKHRSDLALLEGDFAGELLKLAKRVDADALYFNIDYEPTAVDRDRAAMERFRKAGLEVFPSLDHVVYGFKEVVQKDGKPYSVFTPFRRRWYERFDEDPRPPHDTLAAIKGKLIAMDALGATRDVPAPEDYGYEPSDNFPRGGAAIGRKILDAFLKDGIAEYGTGRNVPALPHGVSHISPHLRAGTISIRTCVYAALHAGEGAHGKAAKGASKWLSELIWREFYQAVLAHFPHVATEPFREEAKRIPWRRSKKDFDAWWQGTTGYPIVDAAMVQLNTYGWMHNRLRMISASFLTKDLLIDYREGERYFEQHLADADLASNNGGWQWSASTGTDAAPYFRVFNPVLQSKKFDPNGEFIRSMLPQLAKLPDEAIHAPWELSPLEAREYGFELGRDYPAPIVDHFEARERALAAFAPVMKRS